jgi:predicted NAD-dependent protein-ADP-ribosyltransferase YbiA (DUF1768 family)
MKYIITESRFDKAVFKYLDNQDFIKVNKKENIFFLNSSDDKFSDAQIAYIKSDGECYIKYELIMEISKFFSIDDGYEVNKIIGRWIENTLQRRVSSIIWT